MLTTEDTISLEMKFLRLRNMKYLLLLAKERSTESIQIFFKKIENHTVTKLLKKELGTILLSFKKLKKCGYDFIFTLVVFFVK